MVMIFSDPLLLRQHVKHKCADLVWNAYHYKDVMKKLLDKELCGSLNSVVQLFLQYVIREWACPNCLQTILPFMKNCYSYLPKKGDIEYASSQSLLTRFPVLSCPHCDTQIVVIATSEYSDIFEFRYQAIKGTIFDMAEKRALTKSEIKNLDLVIR